MNCKPAVLGLVIAAELLAQPADSADRTRHRHVRPVQPQHMIACTVAGCIPVPAGCVPVEGRTPSGMPTGFDIIVCPPGRPVR
jgi:hypothetical protein